LGIRKQLILHILEEKDLNIRTLYSVKLSVKCESKIQTFFGGQKFKFTALPVTEKNSTGDVVKMGRNLTKRLPGMQEAAEAENPLDGAHGIFFLT
jgi:hypothetical protein